MQKNKTNNNNHTVTIVGITYSALLWTHNGKSEISC